MEGKYHRTPTELDEAIDTVKEVEKTETPKLWENPTLLGDVEAFDFLSMLGESSKKWFFHYDYKFRRTITKALDVNVPWIYVRPQGHVICDVELLFMKHCGFVSPVCSNCYKVVVRPQTVEELLKLLWIQENKTNRACKCGTEERKSVPASYGGYFYNEGIEEGYNCLDEISALVKEHIGPHVKVFLKRACTEIEAKYGPSDMWPDLDGTQSAFYEAIRAMFDVPSNVPSPPMMKARAVHRWLRWANSAVIDMTCLKFNEGKPFAVPYVTYTRPKEGGDNGEG